jgi:hypothetical protein
VGVVLVWSAIGCFSEGRDWWPWPGGVVAHHVRPPRCCGTSDVCIQSATTSNTMYECVEHGQGCAARLSSC